MAPLEQTWHGVVDLHDAPCRPHAEVGDLPINITTGFFGLNVGGIPLADSSHGFTVLVLLVALFTGLAGWLAFRQRP